MLPENVPSWQWVVWMDKHTYVSLVHMAFVATIYWISPLRPSPVIDTIGHVFMPFMVKCQRKTNFLLNMWNCKWPLLLSMHHMCYMRDYFLAVLCTCLKVILNYKYVNINVDLWSFLYICSNFKSHSFFVPLVYMQGISLYRDSGCRIFGSEIIEHPYLFVICKGNVSKRTPLDLACVMVSNHIPINMYRNKHNGHKKYNQSNPV